MPVIIIIILAVVITLLVVVPITWVVASSNQKKTFEAKIGNADDKAREIIDEALKTAETKKREALLEAKEESLGSTLVSSVAEALSYMDTSNTDTPFEELFPKAKETKDGWQIAYDENGTAVSSNNASYYLTIIKETNGQLNHYSIVLKAADGTSIDTLDLKTSIPRTADEKKEIS